MALEATELISRCKAGNRQALHLLYEQHKSRLLSICKQYAKEDDVAEDLLHDAFVIILTSLNKLEDPEKLESWMASIVRNVGYHYRLRADKEEAALQQLAKEEPETTEAHLTPDYGQLQSLVAQLPQGYQQVFRLSVFEGLSHQEISQLLGIAPHSSSSQLSHAKRMLRLLIKQSWVLILLLIAIPTAIWQFLNREESHYLVPTTQQETAKNHTLTKTSTYGTNKDFLRPRGNKQQADYAQDGQNVRSGRTKQYQIVSIPTDSVSYYPIMEANDTLTQTAQASDTVIYQQMPLPLPDDTEFVTTINNKKSSWDISLTYNGQIGRGDDYLAATSIGKGSFNAVSNTFIPMQFNNWIDYNTYLNYAPLVLHDAETRSIMNIAMVNSSVNGGVIEARYEHELPITLQILLSRQLSKRLSIETGLSYTRLNSTCTSGSSQAYIQEQQRLRYLGIPLRLGWQWYSKAHLSLYSSAGVMLEWPIPSRVNTLHISNGINTFQKKTALDVPIQWSSALGLGLQYDFTPHLGFYIEPSLQYFFDDGSDIQSYRTEHPLQITLPLGIRIHW